MRIAHQFILNDFADTIGLPRFEPHAETPYVLLVDQKWVINISEENERLVLFASIGTLSGTTQQADPLVRPTESLQWTALAGADERFALHLGLQASSGLVVLHTSAQSCDLDTVSFREWMHKFISHLDNWAGLLAVQNQLEPVTAMMPGLLAMGTDRCTV